MRITSRAYALFALVITAGCAAPLDENAAEPGPTDAGSDARRPTPQDGGAGGSGGSGGGGGWGGSGGNAGEEDLDAGDDVELDADLDADLDPDADVDPGDAGVVCLPDDAVVDPECGLCGDPLFGCMLGCLIVDCPNDSTMMCNQACQCAPTPPLCSSLEDGGVDDDASAPDADVDAGPDDDAGPDEDAGLDDGGDPDADVEDAGDEDADVDDAGDEDGGIDEDAAAEDADVDDAEAEDADVEDAETEEG